MLDYCMSTMAGNMMWLCIFEERGPPNDWNRQMTCTWTAMPTRCSVCIQPSLQEFGKKTQQQLNKSDVATDVSVFLPIDKNKIWGIVNMRPQIAYKTSFVNHNYIFNPVAKTWVIILNIQMCPPPHYHHNSINCLTDCQPLFRSVNSLCAYSRGLTISHRLWDNSRRNPVLSSCLFPPNKQTQTWVNAERWRHDVISSASLAH